MITDPAVASSGHPRVLARSAVDNAATVARMLCGRVTIGAVYVSGGVDNNGHPRGWRIAGVLTHIDPEHPRTGGFIVSGPDSSEPLGYILLSVRGTKWCAVAADYWPLDRCVTVVEAVSAITGIEPVK